MAPREVSVPRPGVSRDSGAGVAPGPAAGLPLHRRRADCRGCGGARLRGVLELGPQPLANRFLASAAEIAAEPRFPLDVYLCERCGLVQLLDVIDPGVLFRDYIYVTGTSETMAAHHAAYAREVTALLGLRPADLVVEIGSNDGSLLGRFRALGARTLGVEPAANIAALARADGIDTWSRFFDAGVAGEIRATHGVARLVVGNNVLAHVDDPRALLRGACALLTADGHVVVEVPYLAELLDRREYDTIYHEHLCYFSVTALTRLYERAGLAVTRVDRVAVHGGSLRVYGAPRGGGHAPEVRALIAREREDGLTDPARLDAFRAAVTAHRDRLVDLLRRLAGEGKTVAGYGAPAKGTVLLNYCGIGPALLPYTVDRNPLKVGRLVPGTHVPILPVATLLERQPDHVLILAWNLADEIMAQQKEYRERGGRFILPLPEPRVL